MGDVSLENIYKFLFFIFIYYISSDKINKYTYLFINNIIFFYKNIKIKTPKIQIEEEKKPIKPEIKYEDKYIDQYKALSNDYIFTDIEKELLSKKIIEFKENNDTDYAIKAAEFVFKEKIINLKNVFLMECTPMGNVIMTFDNNKQHFEYYSDSNIPYKFLETIARKFVIIFKCKQIFIDMENELKIYEENLKKKEEKEETERKLEKNNKTTIVKKKNVFAKLKNYNNDIVSTRLGAAKSIPPKTNKQMNIDEKKKYILKEKSNSYSYKGKINNFDILKKVDKSLSNKKLKISFSDYKKLIKNEK
jgi:hypothetical protein